MFAPEFLISKAVYYMIIYHAYCLHERITDGRSNEFESPLNQIFTHGIRLRGAGRNIRYFFPAVPDRPSIHKLPYVFIKTSKFLLHLQKCPGVSDRRVNFDSISYDFGIGE